MISPTITSPDFQRAYGSFGSIVSWLCAFLFSLTENMIISSLKDFSTILFGVFCAVFTLIMAVFVPKLDKRRSDFLCDKSFFGKVCCSKSDVEADRDFSHKDSINEMELQSISRVNPVSVLVQEVA